VLRAMPDRSKAQGALSGTLAQWAVSESLGLEDIRVEEGRLDDVFRALTVTDAASQAAKAAEAIEAAKAAQAAQQAAQQAQQQGAQA
jgi:hypothetical protein